MANSNVEIEDHTDEVRDGIVSAIEKALEIIGSKAEGYAKDICPVDTGNLRNSIAHAVDTGEKSVYIGTNVEYAPYVELGTGSFYKGGSNITGQRAQPYLKPAATEHAEEYRRIAETELKSG